MRLLLASSERGWRGGEVQLGLLAEALADRGHTVVVAAPPGAAILDRLPPGIERRAIGARNDLDLVAAFQLARVVREIGPELVHAFTGRMHAIARLGLRGGPPLVVSRLAGFPAGKGVGGRLKYRGVAAYAAVSSAAAAALDRAGVPLARVRIVPSAVGPAFAPRRVPPPGTAVVGCVAALAAEKGHATLIEACAQLAAWQPALELRLVGDGPERVRLAERARSLGFAGVRFLGAREAPAAVAAELAAMDVFALASRAEGLPTALLEAMAVGVPVVATAVGGVPELIREGETGRLVPSGDVGALAGAIGALLSRPEEGRRLAAAAREVAEAHRIDRVAAAVEALYRDVLAGLPGGRGVR